jgi:hypothetical protein
MTASSIPHFWVQLLGSLAMLAIILTAIGLMIGLVKLADLPRKLGTLLGILISLTILPGILIAAWARMSILQQIALAAIGVLILLVIIPTHRARHRQKS